MSFPWEFASYHLDFEVVNEQPVIGIHTHSANLDVLEQETDTLRDWQDHLQLAPFSFDPDKFGYDGMAKIEESNRVAGWSALRLSVPEAPQVARRHYHISTPRLMPVLTTAAMALAHLNNREIPEDFLDEANPQYVKAWLRNSPDLDSYHGAEIGAKLTPSMLDWLANNPDTTTTEETVRTAIETTYAQTMGEPADDRIRVRLEKPLEVAFHYPGDGSEFFSIDPKRSMTKDLKLTAANNDYPFQQAIILGGIAALNGLAIS